MRLRLGVAVLGAGGGQLGVRRWCAVRILARGSDLELRVGSSISCWSCYDELAQVKGLRVGFVGCFVGYDNVRA